MFWLILTVLVGCLIPLQPLLNSRLSDATELPVFAALVNFAVGLLILVTVFIVLGYRFPEWSRWSGLPWYGYLGGMLGACFVLTGIFVVPQLGATAYIVALLTGQMMMSLLIDHYGILGVPMTSINGARILGLVFLVLGLSLVFKSS